MTRTPLTSLARTQLTLFSVSACLAGATLLTGCIEDHGRYPAVAAGQGGVTVQREEGPPPRMRMVEAPAPAPTPTPTGPTDREIALQKKIDTLEAQSKALQSQSQELQKQIDLLRQEKPSR